MSEDNGAKNDPGFPKGTGVYSIRPAGNKALCLAVQGASTASGAAVILENYTGADHQLWYCCSNPNGARTNSNYIWNKNSRLFLDANQGALPDHDLIQVRPSGGIF